MKFNVIIPTFENYNKSYESIYDGDYVNNHIKQITPDSVDLPDYFMKNLIKPRTFKLETEFKISDLLDSDEDFKEYFDSGEDRYSYDDIDSHELFHEIVVVDGELLDGYNRCANLLRSSGIDATTNAFVAI